MEHAAPRFAQMPVLQRLKHGVDFINQAVKERDTRALVGRVLRETNSLKHELSAATLLAFFKEIYPEENPTHQFLLRHLTLVRFRAWI